MQRCIADTIKMKSAEEERWGRQLWQKCHSLCHGRLLHNPKTCARC